MDEPKWRGVEKMVAVVVEDARVPAPVRVRAEEVPGRIRDLVGRRRVFRLVPAVEVAVFLFSGAETGEPPA